jgi:zinc protease
MRDAMTIARSLRDTPITADELQRARRPFLETLQRNRNSSNAWWLNNLGGVQQHPERAESLRIGMRQYEAITPAELQALARQYLRDDRAFRLFIRPRG